MTAKSGSAFTFIVLMLSALATPLFGQVSVLANKAVDLSGVCSYELHYGQPNYGEHPNTDRKEYSYILHLDKPVLFTHNEDGINAADTIAAVHIVDMKSFARLRNLQMKHIQITCELEATTTGHHHAPAIAYKVLAIKKL